MKRCIFVFAVISLCATARSQSIPLGEIIGEDRTIRDPLYGLTARYPSGWNVRGVTRWGDRENMIYFGAPSQSNVVATLYYRINSTGSSLPGGAEASLRDEAQRKAERRVRGGLADYGNLAESFAFKSIGGHPALSHTASYTSGGGRVYGEYHVRILSEKGVAIFLLSAPLDELDGLRTSFDQLVESARLP